MDPLRGTWDHGTEDNIMRDVVGYLELVLSGRGVETCDEGDRSFGVGPKFFEDGVQTVYGRRTIWLRGVPPVRRCQ